MNFPEIKGGKSSGIDGGTFLRLKDGEKIQGVFQGDPQIFRQHWIGGRSSHCTQRADCEHCKTGDKSKFRFRINFLTKVDGVYVAKVFEQGYGLYLDLKELHESAYDLPTTVVTVSRTGEGTDTRYRVLPAKDNGGLKAADFKRLSAIPLNKLTDKTEETVDDPVDAHDDVPF